MKCKNISIVIRKDEKVPMKETYISIYKSNNNLRIIQKFLDPSKNQSITLNFEECKRLFNLLNYNYFNDELKPIKDRMVVFEI